MRKSFSFDQLKKVNLNENKLIITKIGAKRIRFDLNEVLEFDA
jgi:hypothetical protein